MNALFSFVVALLVVGAVNLLGIVTTIVQYTGLLAVVVVSFVLVFGLFGVQGLPESKVWNSVFFVIFMLVAGYVFRSFGLVRDNSFFIVIFVLFCLVFFVFQFWFREKPVASNAPATHAQKASSRGGAGVSKAKEAEKAAPGKNPSFTEQFESLPAEHKERVLQEGIASTKYLKQLQEQARQQQQGGSSEEMPDEEEGV